MMQTIQIQEVGRIREIKKSIAKVTGLSRCMIGQLVKITENAKGIIVGFTVGEIIIFLLGRIEDVKVGDNVYSKMEPFQIPVGEEFLGRIVNALAEPIDGKGPVVQTTRDEGRKTKDDVVSRPSSIVPRNLPSDQRYPVFRKAPGVLQRVPID